MKMTIGDLKRQLAGFPDNHELVFQGELAFYRLKQRGPKLVQLEFDEVVGFLSDNFRSRNPNVCAVFMSCPVNADGVSGSVDVEIQ